MRFNPAVMFFDLDGTLTDPREGITRCLQHALEKLGKIPPPLHELEAYIGPPLRKSFASLLEDDRKESVEQAITIYRERFSTVGLFENVVYAEVPELLRELQARGKRQFVVTSKPTIFSERIVAHFGLGEFFEGVYGPSLDGRFDNKKELVAHLIKELRIDPADVLMTGDRREDMLAGISNGCGALGVTYGFGSSAELSEAGAGALIDSPLELLALLGPLPERGT